MGLRRQMLCPCALNDTRSHAVVAVNRHYLVAAPARGVPWPAALRLEEIRRPGSCHVEENGSTGRSTGNGTARGVPREPYSRCQTSEVSTHPYPQILGRPGPRFARREARRTTLSRPAAAGRPRAGRDQSGEEPDDPGRVGRRSWKSRLGGYGSGSSPRKGFKIAAYGAVTDKQKNRDLLEDHANDRSVKRHARSRCRTTRWARRRGRRTRASSTRGGPPPRDLQDQAKAQRRPWDAAKALRRRPPPFRGAPP